MSRLNMELRVAKLLIAEFLQETKDVTVSTSKSLQDQTEELTTRFKSWEEQSDEIMVKLVDSEGYNSNVETELRALVTQWLFKATTRRKALLDKCGSRVSKPDQFHVSYTPYLPEMNVTCAYDDQSCLEEVPDDLNGEKTMQMTVEGHPMLLDMLQKTLAGTKQHNDNARVYQKK